MRWLAALVAFLPCAVSAWDGNAADLAQRVRATGLDRNECYRVIELNFAKEDLRFYLTDGYLIFGEPVGGRPYWAVFSADVEAGDAEILVLPPSRSERMSLAAATGSPNLSERFKLAVFVFTDNTYEELAAQLRSRGEPRRSQERGVLLAEKWNSVVRNIFSSFESRIVHDLLGGRESDRGFFYAGLDGNRLGSFDAVYDPKRREQITVGTVASREGKAYFDVWTSFQARSIRTGGHTAPPQEFQVSNFRLDATLEPDLNLKVTTRVTVTPAVEGQRSLAFDLSRRMRITEALIDGEPAEVFQRESIRASLIRQSADDFFLLVSPVEFIPGRGYELEFRHEGEVVADTGNDVYYVGSRDNWYPNRLSQFADYEITFRYPQHLNLVAAGEVVDDRTEGEWRITRRATSAPVRFVGFNLGNYESLRVSRGPYTIEVCANRQVEPALRPRAKQVIVMTPSVPRWPRSSRQTPAEIITMPVELPPPNPAARLGELAAEIADAFEFMVEYFGPPPVKHLTVSPIPGTFGQGFPGMVYLSTMSYLAPKERPAAAGSEFHQLFFSEILHAHETAHQWWGNIVTSGSYQDDWLMEALANYSALLYVERRKGATALESVLAEYQKRLLARTPRGGTVESTGPIIWGVRLRNPDTPSAWQTITYEKGSWVIHMLRGRMGDERFLAMLGELRRRYEYQAVTTEQFRELAAEFLPPKYPDPELEHFFEHWVYSTGVPTLEFRHTVRGRAPAVQVTGSVRQTGVDEDFSAYVPVVIQLKGGRTIEHWLWTSDEPVTFEVPLKEAPVSVRLDPSGSVLAVVRR